MNRPDPMLTHTFLAGVLLATVAWCIGGASFGVAAICSATFALGNVVAFRFVVRRILLAQRSGALIVLKVVSTLIVVFFLQRILNLDPVGIALGYGALVIGLLSAALRQSSLSLRSTEI